MVERTRGSASSGSRFGAFFRFAAIAAVVVGAGSFLLPARRLRPTGMGWHSTPPSGRALEAGHETKDINARGVSYILLGMMVTAAIVVGVCCGMVLHFQAGWRRDFSRLPPEQTARIVPPAPHLQVEPFAELARQRGREEALLNGYGWTSPDHSTARIPIDRAMALIVGKSLDPSP